MKIKNPARHLPHYAIRIHFSDGTQMNKRGSAQPEIDVPVEKGEYLALVFECLNSARETQIKLLFVDGAWVDFSEAALAEMLAPKPEPKPEPVPASKEETCGPDIAMSEPKPKPKPNRKRKPVERKPEPRDEDADDDGRFGLGCN
jgi:outer membrane biosynthesis protein TonB